MRVVDDPTNPGGRTLVLDRVRHAYVDLDDPTNLEFRYVRWFADASAPLVAERLGDVDALHIGGGGFTFPRYLAARAPASRHTVLELDAEVVDAARDELGLDEADAIDIRVGDARTGIVSVPSDAVDLAVGDAFGSLSVPWHLTTVEFLAEVRRVLRDDGLYVMNLIDGRELRFARAQTATFRGVWRHVAVIVPLAALSGSGGSNVVLVGSDAPIDAEGLRGRLADRGDETTQVLADRVALDAFVGAAPVLSDDFAPVDQLLAR